MNEKLTAALQRHYAENKSKYWPTAREGAVTAKEFSIDLESEVETGYCCCDASATSKVEVTARLYNEKDEYVQVVWFETDDPQSFIEALFELID